MKELNELINDYVFDQTNPDLNYKLGIKYMELKQYAASSNYLLKAAELSTYPYTKSNALYLIALNYFKLGDRVDEVKLMCDYSIAEDPTNPKPYALKCVVLSNQGDWIGMVNTARTGVNIEAFSGEYDEIYIDEDILLMYLAYACMRLGIKDEAITIFQSLKNHKNINIKHYSREFLKSYGIE